MNNIPGFSDLPQEQQLLIKAYKDNPEALQVYQTTQLLNLHAKFDKQRSKCDKRIVSLEKTRSKTKWWIGGALFVWATIQSLIKVWR